MPPSVLGRLALAEMRSRADRLLEPRRSRSLGEKDLLALLAAPDLDTLWARLRDRPFPFVDDTDAASRAVELDPGERERILAAAEDALARRIDLLGSGLVDLGTPVDWHRDPKTGRGWPLDYGPGLDYANLDEPSDVKLPWEISRLQWLLPAGQAYLLTGDERYAAGVRDVFEEWIAANPCPLGPNWAIAMEPALRILTWTWLYRACAGSVAWEDPAFRLSFLRALYLHGRFVSRHLERSDVNGNHLDADAAGLVFAGLFFWAGEPAAWADAGWRILLEELPRQVGRDGVDFEASIPYHRLVAELFLLPALYRERLGLEVPEWYRAALRAMASFAAAVTRPDGTSPLIGDNDDARALPLGGQGPSDLRYLAGITGAPDRFSGPRSEPAWVTGPERAAALPDKQSVELDSQAFPEAGVFVLRGPRSHVVVDAGPVGQAGRGGHGHNDCLSFEAWLGGVAVLVDSGCFVYTASPDWRNRMRATGAHNTPIVDGAEQNRLDPALLWRLEPDATPEVRSWRTSATADRLVAAHAGYAPVTPVRTIALDKRDDILAVLDSFEGEGEHEVRIPFHLAPEIVAEEERPGRWHLTAPERTFVLELDDPGAWHAELRPSWVSPSYGVRIESRCLELSRRGPLELLLVAVGPERDPGALLDRARAIVEESP
jgi:uncharacterized heparinase superfamily protein